MAGVIELAGLSQQLAPSTLLPLVITSGFLDGIHPCGIAVLLFFVGFLLYARKTRKEILAVGAAYIAGVFVAYLGIGIGIIGVFSLFPGHFMAKVGASLLMLVGALSLADGVRGKALLKMPKALTPVVEKVLTKSTVPAAFAGGFLVGLCAFPCAGGIYVAIIGLIAANMAGAEGLAYLALYNLMFVMPLVLVLLAASNKTILGTIESAEKKYRRKFQIAVGIVMIAAGGYILFSLG